MGSARPATRRYIGGISKPNRTNLKLSKQSSKLKSCPCPGSSNCNFAFQCTSFKALPLSQKISFLKLTDLCQNCLIQHKGKCEFQNRHTCPDRDADTPTFIYLSKYEDRQEDLGSFYSNGGCRVQCLQHP